MRTFTVYGDSISTLAGVTAPGNRVYYEGQEARAAAVTEAQDTWWQQVIDHFGGRLGVNASFSGSTVGGAGFPAGCSEERVRRMEEHRASHAENGSEPDDILIFMGINDYGWGSMEAQRAGRSAASPEVVAASEAAALAAANEMTAVQAEASGQEESAADGEPAAVAADGIRAAIAAEPAAGFEADEAFAAVAAKAAQEVLAAAWAANGWGGGSTVAETTVAECAEGASAVAGCIEGVSAEALAKARKDTAGMVARLAKGKPKRVFEAMAEAAALTEAALRSRTGEEPAEAPSNAVENFERSYASMLKNLRAFYPRARLWCITLTPGRPVAPGTEADAVFAGEGCADETSRFCYRLRGFDLEEYNDAIRRCAQADGCCIADVAAWGYDYEAIDGTHPTKRGMRQLAALVIAAMEAAEAAESTVENLPCREDVHGSGRRSDASTRSGAASSDCSTRSGGAGARSGAVSGDAAGTRSGTVSACGDAEAGPSFPPGLFPASLVSRRFCDRENCIGCPFAQGTGSDWSCVCARPAAAVEDA